MHKCTSATVIVHIYRVTVALAFNILVIFSLSLSLVALTLTSRSLFLILSNHQTITADQIIKPLPPIKSSNHRHRLPPPLISRRSSDQIIRLARSLIKSLIATATKPLRSPIATDFSLFNQWVSGWVGDDLGFGLHGLVFLDDASWVGDDDGWVWSDRW